MSTLYRKYRPKLWSEVFGQESIKNILKNEILNDKLAHAYIFAGSRGIGKTTTARLFAKTLNCQNRQPGSIEPCDSCDSCLSINNGSSMELIEIDAASNTGVDDVRELKKITRIPPKTGFYKIFIIDEVHMLSKQAFNALLKTLEEPPERVIFILATTEINKILDTIISRCQIFKFKKATNEEIISDLKFICEKEGINVSDDVLMHVAKKAAGGFRDAESLLGQILSSLDQKNIGKDDIAHIVNKTSNDLVSNLVLSITNKDIKSCFEIINGVIESQTSFDDFVLDSIELFRKILIYKYNPDCLDNWKNLSDDVKNEVINLSNILEFTKLSFIINKLIQVKLDIKNCDIIQLPLEIAIVEMCGDRIVSDQLSVVSSEGGDIKSSTSHKTVFNRAPENKVGVVSSVSDKVVKDKDVSVLDILDDNEPKPSLTEVVEKNGLLNHVDPSKREQMMKRFGLVKDPNQKPSSQAEESHNVLVDVKKDQPDEDVSVFDILKDEFADNLEA